MDYLADSLLLLIIVFAFLCTFVAILTMHSNKLFAAKKVQIELLGCDKFLKNRIDCLIFLSAPEYSNLDKLLRFKSKEHQAAFWLGFSISNYLECPALSPAFKGSATPKDLFKAYFSKDIDIGDGALNRKKDEPYALAFFAGEGLFFELSDNYGPELVCNIINEVMGPKGKIAPLLKVSPE